ncbi:MAG: HAD family hydrolase [Actinomycetota bacterium]
MSTPPRRAVLFDLGGVVFPSPFEAFDAHDAEIGVAPGTVRALIRTSSETGAWSRLERGELTMDEFADALAAEATAAGFALDARVLMARIGTAGGPRPAMVTAIGRLRERGLRVGALTNNWHDPGTTAPHSAPTGTTAAVADLAFDAVVESAREGLRKPDPRIYELALTRIDAAADETVFLDDLGINLKPARAMGMATIKVTDHLTALDELSALVGFPLR